MKVDCCIRYAFFFHFILSVGVHCGSSHRHEYWREHVSRNSKNLETDLSESIKQSLLWKLHRHHREGSERHLNLTGLYEGNRPTISFGLNEQKGSSGGFGDRLKGLVTTFYLAIMTNSSFEINWTQPYNLSDYFSVPTCITARQERHSDESGASVQEKRAGAPKMLLGDGKIVRNDVDDWRYFTESLFLNDTGKDVEIHTNSPKWSDVVRNEAFAERASSLGLFNLSQAELFKVAIDELFRLPTSQLIESHESMKRRLAVGNEANDLAYVGVQIRLGGKSSGDVSGWEDPKRHSLEEVQCFAAEAVRLCHQMQVNSIFVTADSAQALRALEDAISREHASKANPYFRSPPIIVHVPGRIGHTDRSSVTEEHSRGVWLKSILDWWLLKHARALVISRSGFGETAAMSSDAEVALRLRFSPDSVAPLKTRESLSCEFEELLYNKKDIFKKSL